jgi:hypothetical protein
MSAPGTKSSTNALFLRMSPPNNLRNERLSAVLDEAALKSIEAIKAERIKMFGKPLTTTVDELPDDVFAWIGFPRIMRHPGSTG